MRRPVVNVPIPYEVLREVNRMNGGKDLVDKVILSLATRLFVEKVVSQEKAAELSGRTPIEMIAFFHTQHIPGLEHRFKIVKKSR